MEREMSSWAGGWGQQPPKEPVFQWDLARWVWLPPTKIEDRRKANPGYPLSFVHFNIFRLFSLASSPLPQFQALFTPRQDYYHKKLQLALSPLPHPCSGPFPSRQKVFVVQLCSVIPWLKSPHWIPVPRGWVPNMRPGIRGPSSQPLLSLPTWSHIISSLGIESP